MAEEVECVVVGAGVIGLAVARHLALRRPRGRHRRGGPGLRHRDELAQLRGHPRRPLLSAQQPQGEAVPRRPRPALRLPRRARRRARTLRQADRRGRRRGDRGAAGAGGARPGQRRRRGALARRRGGARSGAGAPLPGGAVVARHRHPRQPRLHAGAAGRGRGRRRGPRRRQPGGRRPRRRATAFGSASAATRRWSSSAGWWSTPPASAPTPSLRRSPAFPSERLPPRALAKGNYFALAQRPPFTRLVYPLPEAAGLGVHYTRDLAGAGRFGPDVEWIDRIDYSVDPARCERFYDAVRRYWPGLRDGALVPAYAGIRPKISAAGRAGRRLPDPGAGGARRPRPRQPVRLRKPRPHRLAGHRRGGGGAARDQGALRIGFRTGTPRQHVARERLFIRLTRQRQNFVIASRAAAWRSRRLLTGLLRRLRLLAMTTGFLIQPDHNSPGIRLVYRYPSPPDLFRGSRKELNGRNKYGHDVLI